MQHALLIEESCGRQVKRTLVYRQCNDGGTFTSETLSRLPTNPESNEIFFVSGSVQFVKFIDGYDGYHVNKEPGLDVV